MVYDVSAGVRNTRNDDGGIVLDIAQGQMFRLNPVGALIMTRLQEGHVEVEIAREIARQYNVSEEAAAIDLDEFLKSLEQHKLIRVREDTSFSCDR